MQAGRYFRSVRYRRSLPSDSDAARAAKSATTSKAQRYINLKNAAEKVQMLLCANFDHKDACFCTFTFSDDNIPVNRKMVRVYFTAFLASMRRRWKRMDQEVKYLYTVEGSALPDAVYAENIQWEIRPWSVKGRWDTIDKASKKKKRTDNVRFHIHWFHVLNKEERHIVQDLWPWGHVYINPLKVDDPETFYRLSYYVTKEARSGDIPSGARSYIPSRNLDQPIIEGHWCDAHEVLAPPPNAECVHTATEDTDYSSFQYCSYRLPRPKRQPKPYRSKGRIS